MIKKILLSILILAIAGVTFLAFTFYKASETALTPEVEAIVLHTERPDEAILKQDVYAALLAMSAPEGADYIAMGSQIALSAFDNMQQAIQGKNSDLIGPSGHINMPYDSKDGLSLNLNIGKEKYLYDCRDIYAHQCATDTLNKKTTLATVLNNNATLMGRYLQVTQLPNYGTYYYGIADPLPSYQTVMHGSYMRLAQALFAFDANQVEQGFVLLEAEMAFTKRMLAQGKTLIGQMVAVRTLYTLYHTISVAMDMPQLHAYANDERWATLLAPLTTEEQKGMAGAFATERNLHLYLFYALNAKEANSVSNLGKGMLWGAAEKLFSSLLYDRYKTCNTQYALYEPLIQRASLSLEEVSKLKVKNKLGSMQDAMEHMLAEKKTPMYNYIGQVLLDYSIPMASSQNYLDRRYDVQIYGALVNAKRLMIQANIGADQIEAFLKNGGLQTRNPYTQEVFVWNAQTQTLSTPWLLAHKPIAGEEKNMRVQVQTRSQ